MPSPTKRFLREYLENEASPKKRKLDLFISGLIVVSIATYVAYLSRSLPEAAADVLYVFDTVVIAIFAIEYLARFHIASDFRKDLHERGFWHAVGAKFAWMGKPMSIIDLLALLPALRIFRIARIFRLFRLFRLVRHQSSFASVVDIFREHAFELGTVFAFMIAVLIFAGIAMFLLENPTDNPDTQFQTVGDAFWWAIVSMTTVGYGDKVPATAPGRVLAGLVILSGVLVIAFPTAIITSAFTEKLVRLREGKLKMERLSGHIVVCGLGKSTDLLVRELEALAERHSRVADIIVISSFAPASVTAPGRAVLLRGDVTRDRVLREASVDKASVVIVLAERRTPDTPDETVDARTILCAMQANGMNPTAAIVAEILESDNVATITAHVPRVEVIESGALVPRLLAVGTIHRGTSAMIADLLRLEGDSFLEVPLTPNLLEGAGTFGALFPKLRARGMLPVAVRRGQKMHTNPADDFAVATGDVLLVIGKPPESE